jgi:hypothetical protein
MSVQVTDSSSDDDDDISSLLAETKYCTPLHTGISPTSFPNDPIKKRTSLALPFEEVFHGRFYPINSGDYDGASPPHMLNSFIATPLEDTCRLCPCKRRRTEHALGRQSSYSIDYDKSGQNIMSLKGLDDFKLDSLFDKDVVFDDFLQL